MVISRAAPARGERLQQVRQRHTRWLSRNGLLGRPWFVLGSAPEPTWPEPMPDDLAQIHVKYVGQFAKKVGALPSPDLTFLVDVPKPHQIEGLKFTRILRMTEKRWDLRLNRARLAMPFPPPTEIRLSKVERDLVLADVIGDVFRGVGVEERPSNGIFLICYALFVGVPEIIVAGISVTSDGHSYNATARRRRHKEEDAASLQFIAKTYPTVITTEQALSAAVGLPLGRRAPAG